MEEFQAQCVMKVNDRTVDFGPRQFETGCYVLRQHVLLITGSLGNILFPPATVCSQRVVLRPCYGVLID